MSLNILGPKTPVLSVAQHFCQQYWHARGIVNISAPLLSAVAHRSRLCSGVKPLPPPQFGHVIKPNP